MREWYAEDVNYWKTSRVGVDTWLDRAEQEIIRVGGNVVATGWVSGVSGSGCMFAFKIGEDSFKMSWPVLNSKSGDTKAARVQSATALYHEVKSSCVKMKFLGARVAFFADLVLPGGSTASQLSLPELAKVLPPRLGMGDQ